MKEIKFKGIATKDSDGYNKGDLIYGQLLRLRNPLDTTDEQVKCFIIDSEFLYGSEVLGTVMYEVEPDSVKEFINKKDDLGNDIYNGDKCIFTRQGEHVYNQDGEIIWNYDLCRYEINHNFSFLNVSFSNVDKIRINK